MKKIRLVKFDEMYDESKRITNYKPIDKDKTFTDDGVYSETIFGTLSDDNIEDIGWICTDGKYIINPIMYNHIEKVLGKKLERMIKFNRSINREGEVLEQDMNDDEVEEDDNIGLYEFKERFLELLGKWGNLNKYEREYNFILKNQKYVFTDKIPVFNSKLRPASFIANTLTADEINNEYNLVLRYLEEIKDIDDDYMVLPLMYGIQNFANKIWNMIITDYLRGKKGFLRKNNLGSRINNSARFVITPLINTPIDEVSIPYVGFAELYKYQLISLIATSKKINYLKAERIWRKKSLKFDEELYKYMMLLMNNTPTGCRILLNRNPSLAIGSILFLRIGSIKKDYNDLTLSISNNLLNVLAGDYLFNFNY